MTNFTDNAIFLARQQEQQKLPQILAYGIGGSLMFHGVAALAFNYLPKPVSTPVEVTLIDPSEIPPELKPSPQPPQITPAKPKKIAKITPLPTPTASVKSKPEPKPQIVKIVTKLIIPALETTKTTANDFEKNQNQQSQTATKPNKKQVESSPDRTSENLTLADSNSSPLNNSQLALKDLNRSTEAGGLFGTEANLPAGENSNNDQFNNVSPGGGSNSQAATPGNLAAKNINNTVLGGNGQPLTSGRVSRLPGAFGGSDSVNSAGGSGSDGFEVAASPGSGDGSRSTPGGNTGGNRGNGQPLAAGRKFGGGSGGSGTGGGIGDEGDGLEAGLNPNRGKVSRSISGIGQGSGGNGRLAHDQTKKSNRGLGTGSGFGDGFGSDEGSLGRLNSPGGLVRSHNSGVIRGGSKGFGSGLECIANCRPPEHSETLDYDLKISANITLDDSGRVVGLKLPSPSGNIALNKFTETEFGKMQFKLPENVTKRNFSVHFMFKKNSY